MPPAFAARLQKEGIHFQAGQCLIEGDAGAASRMLDVIRELELPIVLLFNRSRVMAMSQGISKATGLRAALETLRKSPRNAVAVGADEVRHHVGGAALAAVHEQGNVVREALCRRVLRDDGAGGIFGRPDFSEGGERESVLRDAELRRAFRFADDMAALMRQVSTRLGLG